MIYWLQIPKPKGVNMKTKTVAILAALAGLAACASEQPWFDAKVSTYDTWPTNSASFGGAWSSNAQDVAVLVDGKVNFDATVADPLAFTAETQKTLGTDAKTVKIASRIDFVPYAANNLPEIPAEAKAGIVVVKDGEKLEYYVVLSDGENNAWTNSAIAASAADSEVVISIATNGTGVVGVTYEIGNNRISGTTLVSDGTVKAACFAGGGKLAELAATYDAYTQPIVPGTNTVVIAASSEKEAMAQVEIVPPESASGVVTDRHAYAAMFRKSAKKVGEGEYEVTVEFDTTNETVVAIQNTVDAATSGMDLTPVQAGSEGTATIGTTVPGVYYVLEADGELQAIVPRDEKLGEGNPITLTMPPYVGKGFYRIKVSPTSLLKK